MTDPFADIRPYRDAEVEPVLARLLQDPELLGAIAKLRMGRLANWLPGISRAIVRHQLGREVDGVRDVHAMQMVIKSYVERMIEGTTGGFSVTGLEKLDKSRAYLFMSNHRDITMDPAFTNYALNCGDFDTVRIAIGDNLLTKPWVSDLMRLNKSFIVKRTLSGPRELLAATKHLSAYIGHSLHEENAPIWIAQREGRAKDGLDKTEPAIIKMLAMSRNKREQAFGDFIAGLSIVPVAISYELDPCDDLKANELHHLATQGSYEKGAQEDVASIARGISGNKGRVHVSFGTPLGSGLETPAAVAAEVDRQVISNYCLHPTNLQAYRMLHGDEALVPEGAAIEDGDCSPSEFDQRINAMPEAHRPYALAIYANAVVSKLALTDGVSPSC